jgi:signal transduction histidine kinase
MPQNLTLILAFSILLIFQLGVLFVTIVGSKYFQSRNVYRLWLSGVIFSCFGYLLSILELYRSVQLLKLSSLVTGASFCFGISAALLVLIFQGLDRKKHSKKLAYLVFLIATAYTLLFEYGRLFESFVFRGVLTSAFYCLTSFLGLYLLYCLRRSNESVWSHQLYLPAAAIIGNILASTLRSTFLLKPHIFGMSLDISISITFFVLSQVFFTLMFVGVAFFWVEELGIINKRVSIETNEYRSLVKAKERTLNQLLLSQKSTMLGAYSHLIAHEINQPLASLQINADFLKSLLSPRIELGRENALVDSIIAENIRAASIVRTIRSLLTQETVGSTFFSVDALVTEAATVISNRLNEKKIELKLILNVPALVLGNKDELQLVLFNLLENAISALVSTQSNRHTDGLLQLETYVEHDNVVLRIADNGPGVRQEYLESLFELHSTSKAGGSGMGLWLSSHIAKRHNGNLIYENSFDGGACFTLSFPAIYQCD